MELETTNVDHKPVSLNEEEQQKVVNFVCLMKQKGKDARAKYEEDWEKCDRAYLGIPEDYDAEEVDFQSNLVLPWAYDAVESWVAHMHSTLMPRDEEIFSIQGRTSEDHPGADVMETYLEYRLDENKFPQQFWKALMQLARKNHTCVKNYWKDDKETFYEWREAPVIGEDGQPAIKHVKVPNERQVFNNVWMDVIDIEDFFFYPIHGDIHKTTRIHRTYRFKEDLIQQAKSGQTPYFNIDKLEELKDDDTGDYDRNPTASGYDIDEENERKKGEEGVEIYEAWIHRIVIEGKVYRNYVATVVDEKVLIRFQPNPYPMGQSPFHFIALNPDGNCNYGYGLISPGLQMLYAANRIFNGRIDEIEMKIHPPYKYWDDQVFNPYDIVTRTGAMVRMADIESVQANLMPLNPMLEHLQIVFAEVAELKAEFESVTVPKVVKGLIETKRDTTATEQRLAHNSSSGRMHGQGHWINNGFLKPVLEMFYSLIYDRLDELKPEIARLTQPAVQTVEGPEGPQQIQLQPEQMVMMLPQFLPLPDVDIKMVGYENEIKKQETLLALNQFIGQVYETPIANYLKWPNIGKIAIRMMNLSQQELMVDDDEQESIDQQSSQEADIAKQVQLEAEKAKIEMDKAKAGFEQARVSFEQQKINLEEYKTNLNAQLEELKLLMEGQELAHTIGNDEKTHELSEKQINRADSVESKNKGDE